MAPAGDWDHSAELVRADIARNADDIRKQKDNMHKLRDSVQSMLLSSNKVLNEQTITLTKVINDNHSETMGKISDLENTQNEKHLKLSLEVNTLSAKASIWGAAGGMVVGVILKWILK